METLIEGQVKFLVFAHHYVVLDKLEDYMLKQRVNYIRIDGRVDVKKRYEAVNKFQKDPKCTCAILSLTASSQGITLTAAQVVVFTELNWTPGIMVQAEDRAHRIGQASSVTVYYLCAEETIDSLIYPRLRLKSEVISTVVDGRTNDETFKSDNTMVIPHSAIERRPQPAFYNRSFWQKQKDAEVERKRMMEENEKVKMVQHLDRDNADFMDVDVTEGLGEDIRND